MSKNKFNGIITGETGQGDIGKFSFEGNAGDRPGPIEGTITVKNTVGGAPEQKSFTDTQKETFSAGPVKGRLAVENVAGNLLAEVVFTENFVQTRIGGGELENNVGRLNADDGQLPAEMSRLAGLVAKNQDDPAAMRKALLEGLGIEVKEEARPAKPGPARLDVEASITPVKSADAYFTGRHEPRKSPAKSGSQAARLTPPQRTL